MKNTMSALYAFYLVSLFVFNDLTINARYYEKYIYIFQHNEHLNIFTNLFNDKLSQYLKKNY